MGESGGGGDPVDVLLVEDNPGDVRLTEEAFDRNDIETELHVVTDGHGALEYLRRRGDHEDAPRPDLVLLDLNLPGKSGDEILRTMAEDPALADIPVVVLTSSDTEEDVRRAYDLQANAYLTKPVDPEAFMETIRSFQTFWLETVRLPPPRCEG